FVFRVDLALRPNGNSGPSAVSLASLEEYLQTHGRGVISNHEYFARVVKGIYGLIGDTTEHGFVFRVDLALRPNGNSGPSAVSLASLEEYLQTHG
ncbi:hypothetical protein, partial [Escherichia coli]|uniref:hypothetical protein n=1 Tax=Escherichia coli TaxID=562 RepID=UPI001BC87FDD